LPLKYATMARLLELLPATKGLERRANRVGEGLAAPRPREQWPVQKENGNARGREPERDGGPCGAGAENTNVVSHGTNT
jgi:hypothetical protein